MSQTTSHISVCVCTYKRPAFLARLLNELAQQHTESRFSYSVVVADNDAAQSARFIVSEFGRRSSTPITYCVEPRQGIARARNRVLESAGGTHVAFIDDDEFPANDWLVTLFMALDKYQAHGVLGPVRPFFEIEPPSWVIKGRFYHRPTYPTALVIDWRKGRTGNVLLRREIFTGEPNPFDPAFPTGEDQDFFRRMIEKGYKFVWCDEAVAYEVVPPARWKRSFMIRRALLRGKASRVHPTFGATDVIKSLVAIPTYLLALPALLLLGHHLFMRYLIKLFDHLGRILAVLGIDLVKESYVTD